MDSHSRIYWYRVYLRDTRARIVRPNNMPGLCGHTRCQRWYRSSRRRIFTTLRLEKSHPGCAGEYFLLPFSLYSSAAAATEFARASDDRLLLYISLILIYLVPQRWYPSIARDVMVDTPTRANLSVTWYMQQIVFWCAVKLDWIVRGCERKCSYFQE